MRETHRSKVLIVGSGPAGYTAAIYAARANLQPILVQGLQPGGQMTITTDVENYPGFADVIQGPWLMDQMQAQATHVGTRIFSDIITSVDLSQRPFRAEGDNGDTYLGETLIIATGAQARWLGLASEQKFRGGGVSACATCDGFFFRGKEVCIVGGGNTAVEEAIFLTHHANKVTLIHRRDSLRAEKIMQDRLFANPKIALVWDSAVEEVLGEGEPAVVRAREGPQCEDRRALRGQLRRAVRRHRPHALDRTVQGQAGAGWRGLHHHQARQHGHRRSRRLRRGRREGQDFPPGGHRRRHGLHGSTGSRSLSRFGWNGGDGRER